MTLVKLLSHFLNQYYPRNDISKEKYFFATNIICVGYHKLNICRFLNTLQVYSSLPNKSKICCYCQCSLTHDSNIPQYNLANPHKWQALTTVLFSHFIRFLQATVLPMFVKSLQLEGIAEQTFDSRLITDIRITLGKV